MAIFGRMPSSFKETNALFLCFALVWVVNGPPLFPRGRECYNLKFGIWTMWFLFVGPWRAQGSMFDSVTLLSLLWTSHVLSM